MQGHERTQAQLLKMSGLDKEPELLIEFEKIFDEIIKRKSKQKSLHKKPNSHGLKR